MDDNAIAWPVKQRDLVNAFLDSTVWNRVRHRPDDIVIATYPKSGTTWMQQIVAQLLCQGYADLDLSRHSPWVDMREPGVEGKLSALDAQTHRRFMKCHLPLDALAYSPRVRYIYVARDGRDVAFSLHSHYASFLYPWFKSMADPEVDAAYSEPSSDPRAFFRDWMKLDGFPALPFFAHVRSWLDHRDLPNLKVVHYNNLKADLAGQVRAIAAFLGIRVAEDRWPAILERCGFSYMKQNAARLLSDPEQLFEGGAGTFMNRGVSGRWRDVLTPEDSEGYEALARAELGDPMADWLATGQWRVA